MTITIDLISLGIGVVVGAVCVLVTIGAMLVLSPWGPSGR